MASGQGLGGHLRVSAFAVTATGLAAAAHETILRLVPGADRHDHAQAGPESMPESMSAPMSPEAMTSSSMASSTTAHQAVTHQVATTHETLQMLDLSPLRLQHLSWPHTGHEGLGLVTGLLVVAALAALGARIAGPRLSRPVPLVAALLAVQVGTHSVLCGDLAGAGSTRGTAAMIAGHLIATAITGIALACGDVAARALLAAVDRRLRPWLAAAPGAGASIPRLAVPLAVAGPRGRARCGPGPARGPPALRLA